MDQQQSERYTLRERKPISYAETRRYNKKKTGLNPDEISNFVLDKIDNIKTNIKNIFSPKKSPTRQKSIDDIKHPHTKLGEYRKLVADIDASGREQSGDDSFDSQDSYSNIGAAALPTPRGKQTATTKNGPPAYEERQPTAPPSNLFLNTGARPKLRITPLDRSRDLLRGSGPPTLPAAPPQAVTPRQTPERQLPRTDSTRRKRREGDRRSLSRERSPAKPPMTLRRSIQDLKSLLVEHDADSESEPIALDPLNPQLPRLNIKENLEQMKQEMGATRDLLQTQVNQANAEIAARERDIAQARKEMERTRKELELTKRALDERNKKQEEENRRQQRMQIRLRQRTRPPMHTGRSDEQGEVSPPRNSSLRTPTAYVSITRTPPASEHASPATDTSVTVRARPAPTPAPQTFRTPTALNFDSDDSDEFVNRTLPPSPPYASCDSYTARKGKSTKLLSRHFRTIARQCDVYRQRFHRTPRIPKQECSRYVNATSAIHRRSRRPI